jgi:hypothetical protein
MSNSVKRSAFFVAVRMEAALLYPWLFGGSFMITAGSMCVLIHIYQPHWFFFRNFLFHKSGRLFLLGMFFKKKHGFFFFSQLFFKEPKNLLKPQPPQEKGKTIAGKKKKKNMFFHYFFSEKIHKVKIIISHQKRNEKYKFRFLFFFFQIF